MESVMNMIGRVYNYQGKNHIVIGVKSKYPIGMIAQLVKCEGNSTFRLVKEVEVNDLITRRQVCTMTKNQK